MQQGIILDGTKMVGTFSQAQRSEKNGYFKLTSGKILKSFINKEFTTKKPVRVIMAETKKFPGDESYNDGWTEIVSIKENFGNCNLRIEAIYSHDDWIEFNIARRVLNENRL